MDANASSPRANAAPSETHAPSNSNTTEGKGAAEEPEPTNANNTTNGGKVKTPTKGVVKGMAKGMAKAKGKGKGGGGPELLCANCGQPGSQRCTGCGHVHYCNKNMGMKNGKLTNACQQEHWRCGGHKSACKAYVLAATVHAQQERLCKAAVETDRCLICLERPR